jgi:DNA-binding HxlR family transcriptional regulator
MARSDANASIGSGVRAGSRVLSVFENPLNTRILRAHFDGPQRPIEVQKRIGWSAQTTVRAAISSLCLMGALTKQSIGDAPSASVTALSATGEEMLMVADEVELWLARCPRGPIAPDGEGAKAAVRALAGGWSSTLTRALVSGPLTVAELSRLVPDMSRPSLERRISWMCTSGQIEPAEKKGRGIPYVVTDWLRHSVAPICVAGRCERRHLEGEGVRATSIEVEAAFLLAVPLVQLSERAQGSCTLAVQIESSEPSVNGDSRLAGVTVDVLGGEVVACAAGVGIKPDTWAIGVSTTWLDVVIDGRIDDLRIGGDCPQLALDLAAGIHFVLFGNR